MLESQCSQQLQRYCTTASWLSPPPVTGATIGCGRQQVTESLVISPDYGDAYEDDGSVHDKLSHCLPVDHNVCNDS